ncbi:MAG: hypothetical protein Q9M28_06915 [Mariprofundaceae bacterium]|nr:hypothetical protein [Mariprofundaceae bacterium]
MKKRFNISHILSLFVIALFVLGISQQSYAAAPANSTITNTASLIYTGISTPITASVDVSVTLVAAAPTLSAPADNTVAAGQPSTVSYTITATSNGPDTYNLGSGLIPTNLTAPSGTATYTPNAVTLGATALIASATLGANTLTVPSDGAANSSVNGIVAGDTLVIGANTYTVASVVDNATGTSTITLTSNLLANVSVGTLVAEQQTFSMNIASVGAVTATGVAANISTVTTATSVANAAQKSTDTHLTNVVEVSFEKLVRNVTTPNGAGAVVINAQNYFATAANISAASGDTLEYVIRVTAPAGTPIAGAVVTDAVPIFTTYVANSTRLNTITVAGDGATSPLIAGLSVDDDSARVAAAAATGAIAAAASAVVIFQVTVD